MLNSRRLLGVVVTAAVIGSHATAQRKVEPPPVVQNRQPVVEEYGDWVVEPRQTYVGAYTNNPAGASFGVLCGRDCVLYFSSTTSCDSGATYPALVATSGGAASVTVRCTIVEKTYVYVTELTSDLISAFEIGGKIGIVIPLKGVEFGVSRFSLTGALTASKRAAAISEARMKAKDAAPQKDFDS